MEEDIFCLRGFEAFLSIRAVQQKLLRRVAGIQAVLDSQYRQRLQGNQATDYARRIIQVEYCKVTTPSRNQALERAALDAREVLEDQPPSAVTVTAPDTSLKHQFDRLMHIKAGSLQPTLRSVTSGPLQLRKTVPNTA
jgi:hypothetical protein